MQEGPVTVAKIGKSSEVPKPPVPASNKQVSLARDDITGGLVAYSFDEDCELAVDDAIVATRISPSQRLRADRINRIFDTDLKLEIRTGRLDSQEAHRRWGAT